MNHPRVHRQASVELTVPFHDLDPMQVVWHGNHLSLLFSIPDEVRAALLGGEP